MENGLLKNGVIIIDARNCEGIQDYLEIRTEDGKDVILTATPSGKFRVGLCIEKDDIK